MRKGMYSQQAYVREVYLRWFTVCEEFKRMCNTLEEYSEEERYALWDKFESVTGELIAAGHNIKRKGIRRIVDDAVDTWIVWAG
jgi:hypothetical protein